jgi:Predicted nucleotide-binding protein containing TIR-like domain/Histidine-specific methyltransferase, SAM-dependent
MKKRMFIGSSTESLDVADAVQVNLDKAFEVTVWTQGIFELSKSTLESLMKALDDFDVGIFVFAPDDVTKIRGSEHQTVRDNVLFELGLFIGRLGRDNSYIILPVSTADFHLPTDLLGLTAATYNPNREDKNLVAALGPACHWIRKTATEKQSPKAMPLIKLSPTSVDKQVGDLIPKQWGCRSLYLGLTGAKNWLSIVNDANHYYKADYFKDIVSDLLAEKSLKSLKIKNVVSLGPGDGGTDQMLCSHLGSGTSLGYVPVDINPYLLTTAVTNVGPSASIEIGVVCDFEDEMSEFLRNELHRYTKGPYLILLLGYTVCNLDEREGKFFSKVKDFMRKGDYLLFDYLAVDDRWDYQEYSRAWHTEWDSTMRRFICDAVARRHGEDREALLSEFETRFNFELGKSDISDSYATCIRDKSSGLLVTNIRRYRGFKNWLESNFNFKTLTEHIRIKENHAGQGYILVEKT